MAIPLQGLDAALPSIVMHIIFYLSSLAAPFPFYVSPATWARDLRWSACYQLAAALMLVVALFRLKGHLHDAMGAAAERDGVALVGADGMLHGARKAEDVYKHRSFRLT